MDNQNDGPKERKKKKVKKVLKRKVKKDKGESVDEVTSLVKGLKVKPPENALDVPDITVAETKSQPQSRRGSTSIQALPVQFLLNPKEVSRRSSDAAMPIIFKEEDENLADHNNRRDSDKRRDSIENWNKTRRGSMKRGSLTWQEEEELETKRLKAAIEAMGMRKKAQKEFCWDSVKTINEPSDVKVKRSVKLL